MKKIKKILSVLTVIGALGATLVSCGPTSEPTNSSEPTQPSISEPTSPEVVAVSSITASIDKSTIKIGETANIAVEVSPSNATDKSYRFETSSSNVSVTENGVVTGIAAGSATIKVISNSNNEKFDTIDVIVKDSNDKSNLSLDELTAELEASPYSSKTLGGDQKYGLSNPEVVGVNQEEIKELYPVISVDEADKIYNVKDITLEFVNKYFDEANEANDYNKIASIIEDAKTVTGKKLVVFEENKVYDLTDMAGFAFKIQDIEDLYFDGNNSTLLLNHNEVYAGYFSVTNSKNIHFNDIKLELKRPSSFTGTVSAANVNDRTITIDIDKEQSEVFESYISKSNPKIRSWVEFHHQTKAPLQGGNFIVDGVKNYVVEGDKDSGYKLVATFSTAIARPRNGSFVAFSFTQYDQQGISITNSENVYIENVTMHNAAGMGLVASSVRNFYVNRFNLAIKEGSNQLMTATADAMHFVLMHGDCKVTNSLIENSHDDALNIKHGYWYKLTDAVGGSTKEITVTKLTGAIERPKEGDKLAIYEELTFEGHNPTQGYYTVKEVSDVAGGYKIKVNERMANVGEWGISRVTFMSDTPNFLFRNNIIRNKRNRGILVQVPDAIVENNTFMNVGHGSIQAASAMDIYNECTTPQGITIKNNKFINNCFIKPEPLYGDISIFAISSNATVAPAGTLHGITIENNYIAKNGNSAVSLRGVGGNSIIKDNLFNECSQSQPSGDTFNAVFHMYNVADVTLSGNYNNYTLGNNQCGIMTEGKTVEAGITLDNNTNIKFFVNEDAGPVVEISKAKSSITIDGNIADWEAAEAANVEIFGVSDAEGNERTAEELQDHFKINKLMLTHDDKGIYIGFDIFDDAIDIRTVNDFWLGDCVEIFMSSIVNMPNADMQVYKDEGGVLQAAFASRWASSNFTAVSEVRTNSKYVENKSLIEANVVQNSSGYVGEILIPYTLAPEFKEAVDAGSPIDIAIVVADAERANIGLKRVQMANVPHFVESYKTKTARMPQYIFK